MLRSFLRRSHSSTPRAALAATLIVACGGVAGSDLDRRNSDHPSLAGSAGAAGAAVEPPPPPPPPPIDDEQPVDMTPFEEPGCPGTPPVTEIYECDPLTTPSGCAEGQACFPFVSYPSGPCDVERYGSVCRTAGTGTQGQPCDSSACAADHVCVSTGRGTLCARLCALDNAEGVCDQGLLCLPIDIEGYGGCL